MLLGPGECASQIVVLVRTLCPHVSWRGRRKQECVQHARKDQRKQIYMYIIYYLYIYVEMLGTIYHNASSGIYIGIGVCVRRRSQRGEFEAQVFLLLHDTMS